jgi:hypothetical protein
MRQTLTKARTYSLVLLKATSRRNEPGVEKIIWEHARRNFALRAEGILSIVCPVADGTEQSGIGIFPRTVDETRTIMDGDHGVRAGVFTYELHSCRSFPGDTLP